MQLTKLLTFVAIAASGAEAFDIEGWVKNLLGFRPSGLRKINGKDRESALDLAGNWNNSKYTKKKKGSELYFKEFRTHKKSKEQFRPIFLFNKHSPVGGVYVQKNCAKSEGIDNKFVTKTMKKSIKKQTIYTVRCENKVTTEKH